MFIKWYMSDLFACGHVRGEVPARQINKQFEGWRMDCKGEILLSDLFGTNIMVFQREHKPTMLEKMRIAQAHGVRCVYDLDDDLLNTPEEFEKPHEFYAQDWVRQNIMAFLNECDAVMASTYPMAMALQAHCPRTPILIAENYLDVEMWDLAYAERMAQANDQTVTIGWMASGSHAMDAPLVLPALEHILSKFPWVRLHLIGWVGWGELGPAFEKFKDRITADNWVDISMLPTAMQRFDIGMAPLKPCAFNTCKSAIKAFQYWALGAPIVCSDEAPYALVRDGETGFKCRTPPEWVERLELLVTDHAFRKGMGAAGRLELLKKWDIRVGIGQWINTFRAVCKMDEKRMMKGA